MRKLTARARTPSISLRDTALVVLLLIGQSRSTVTVPLPKNLQCPLQHFFDYTGLKCSECDAHVCVCPSTSLLVNVECSIDQLRAGQCKATSCLDKCDLETVVSRDQQSCIPCSFASERNSTDESSSFYDASLSDCSCRNPPKGSPTRTHLVTKKLVEIYHDTSGLPVRKACLRCPDRTAVITADLYNDGQEFYSTAGKRFIADPYSCVSCPDPHMVFDTDYSCVCDDGYFLTGEASIGEQSCIKNAPSVSTSYSKVRFRDPVGMLGGDAVDFTIESITFSHMYTKVAAECEFYDGSSESGLRACQALGNLCALSMYDEDTPACKQLMAISERRVGFYHGVEDWKYSLPWLYYRDEEDRITNDRSINMKVSFHSEANQVNVLRFKLAKYTINGTFVGIEDVTNQFEFCSTSSTGGEDQSVPHWSGFGLSYRREYSCELNKLLEEEMFLYDMYLVEESSDSCDDDTSISDCLYPVPVLIRNLVKEKQFPNFNQPDGMDDVYTRRFFLFDNESGRTWSGTEAVRYANKIVLQIQTQSENPSKLYPPKLTIQYATATSSSWSDNEGDADSSLVFHVEYSMKTDNFWSSIQIIIGFLCAVGVVIFCIHMINWQSRQKTDTGSAGSTAGLWFMLHAFLTACHTLAMLFFLCLFLICAYWFVFFKLQHDVFLLLPPENELYLFEATLHALFWCQTMHVAYTIVQQCQIDVIFVDWELCKPSKSGNGVPMWRLLLVADLWNKMQARRRSNITFSLVFIGFVMTGLGQNQNAIPRPNFQYSGIDVNNNNNNIALDFANTVIFWVVTAVIQWVWRFGVYERFIGEPVATKFVDLCTVCNISVFIMMENHKGYYLHCKSPFQCAECSMKELLKNLEREGRGLSIARSLDGSSMGCQTFDFYASPVFRRQISKMFNYARPKQDRLFFRSNSIDAEKMSLARDELTLFLQCFIDRRPPPSRDGLRYVVRESWLAERLMGITPTDFRTKSEPTCIMHPDNYGFLSSTFLGVGVEIDLLIHDILTYNVASMVFNNVGTSLIITYAVHLARTFLRSWFGKKNLSDKALIDDRFLG